MTAAPKAIQWAAFKFVMLTVFAAIHCHAQNVWTNTSGGNWEDPNWSYGYPSDSAIITNAGSKTIVIGANAWAQYSNSLAYVSPLLISAPDGYTNRLLIDATVAPIHFSSSSRCLDTNGVLENLGGTLVLHSPEIYGTLLQSGGTLELGGDAFLWGLVMTSNSAASAPDYLRIEPSGECDQTGGTNNVGGLPLSGTYRLTNGVFITSWMYNGFYGPGDGRFYQYGGSTIVSNSVRADGEGGVCIYDGTFSTPQMDLGVYTYYDSGGNPYYPYYGFGGKYFQYGGTANIGNIRMAGGYRENGGGADFALYAGTLVAGSLNCPDAGNRMTQYGGTFNVANLNLAGWLSEYQGIFGAVIYTLSGGTLISANEGLYLTHFIQTGGTNRVDNLKLSGSGTAYWTQLGSEYSFCNGTLIATNIDLFDRAVFSCSGPATSGRIRNDGHLRLNGTILTYGESEQFGRLILAARNSGYSDGPSELDLGTNGHVVINFANSSAETWDTNALLEITGWRGSVFGGGSTQVFFGTDSTGLTASQLQQIRIAVFSGDDVPAGIYRAKILPTGEVVPVIDRVFVNQANSNMLLSWYGDYTLQMATNVAGPYIDVPNATSPFTTAPSATPQSFYRLRAN